MKRLWRIKYSQVAGWNDVELVDGRDINYLYPAHIHQDHSIAMVLAGHETTDCRNRSETALPGDLLLINADEVHSSLSVNVAYRIIKVKSKTLDQIASSAFQRSLQRPHFRKLIIKDALLFRLLLKLYGKLRQNGPMLERESEFVSTIGLLLTRQHEDQITSPLPAKEAAYQVKTVREYLKANYSHNVSLAQLTSLTKLSSFHLLRVFRREVGCPPHEYQTQVRISEARKLIRQGDSILDVALKTGFFDQSHFSRNFKRIVGLTPGQYSVQSKIVQDASESL